MYSPVKEARRLTAKFGLQVSRVRIIQKGVYQITTVQSKRYCLKRMPLLPSRIRWIDSTLKRMHKQDHRIRVGWPGPKLRAKQKLFVRLNCPDCPPFMLIPWIHGTWPSPRSMQQVRACGKLLARFHQAGQQIKIPVSGQHRTNGTWITYLRKEQQILQAAIRKAGRDGFRSPLDRFLKQNGRDIIRMSNQSIDALEASGYRKACTNSKLTLCHGDLGPTNLIRSRKGTYIIDFETLRLDLRAFDLYKAIFNFCQRNHWKFATAKAFLDGYQSVSKLRPLDFRLLKALLRFPRGISKHIQHYSNISAAEKRKVEREAPVILSHERKRADFLRKLDGQFKD